MLKYPYSGSIDRVLQTENEKVRFSVITCSIDPNNYMKLRNCVEKTFSSPVQMINVVNTPSLTEGYNRGFQQAIGDYVIFCHDDIEILNSDIELLLDEDFQKFDIVGVAGTSKLLQGNWISAGQPYIHGHVAHIVSAGHNTKYNLCQYGMGRDNEIAAGIQALDGLFIAVRREVMDDVCFDEVTFDGFHLYDLDFTYNAYLKGYKLAVDYRIGIIHASGGNYDDNWKRYSTLFQNKYREHLASAGKRGQFRFDHQMIETRQALRKAMRVG